MVALLDDLGIWYDLGTIYPDGNWQSFPVPATKGLSIFRVTWGGDLSKVSSRVYLRSVYNRSGFSQPDARWRKLFPKQGSEIVFILMPEELLGQNVSRGFQAIKWYKYLKTGINIDSQYSLNLQEFQPLPNLERNFKPLSPSTLEEIVVEVLSRIREDA